MQYVMAVSPELPAIICVPRSIWIWLPQVRQIEPQRLPPTERAACFHYSRVHCRVRVWKTFDGYVESPEEWGWKNAYSLLLLVITGKVVPQNLVSIRCKCKLYSVRICARAGRVEGNVLQSAKEAEMIATILKSYLLATICLREIMPLVIEAFSIFFVTHFCKIFSHK